MDLNGSTACYQHCSSGIYHVCTKPMGIFESGNFEWFQMVYQQEKECQIQRPTDFLGLRKRKLSLKSDFMLVCGLYFSSKKSFPLENRVMLILLVQLPYCTILCWSLRSTQVNTYPSQLVPKKSYPI